MTELEKMKAGQLYDYSDPEIFAAHVRAVELCDEYNDTKRTETARREEILRKLFGSLGTNPVVEKNIRVDYGFNCARATISLPTTTASFSTARPSPSATISSSRPSAVFIRSITRWTPPRVTRA